MLMASSMLDYFYNQFSNYSSLCKEKNNRKTKVRNLKEMEVVICNGTREPRWERAQIFKLSKLYDKGKSGSKAYPDMLTQLRLRLGLVA